VNTLFAAFDPDAHGVPLPDVVVRPATHDDLHGCVALAAQREGGSTAEWLGNFERRFDDDSQRLFVACVGDDLVGYGRVAWLTPTADGGHGAPDGWYLSGVVVAPAMRRRGLGLRLTRARVEWVLERTSEVFYAVSASNLASRRLHESLGFRELTRDFSLPGVLFGNSDGMLCRLARRPDADVIDLDSRRHTAGG